MTASHHSLTGQASLRLSLLDDFSLQWEDARSSGRLAVGRGGQRLLALLALHRRPLSRAWIAELLWGESDERHASWSLRSELHRLPRLDNLSPVEASDAALKLSPLVAVDINELEEKSIRCQDDRAVATALSDAEGETLALIRSLERDVLPDWYEDWVVVERERHRQLRLHALEALTRRLTALRRYGLAIHAGLAAVRAEPLRESAHRVVIEAHLAQGNAADALRQYGVCRRHLLEDLAITPTPSLQQLVFGGSPDVRRRESS